MTKQEKQNIIKISWELHNKIESNYINHPAKKGSANWLEKQHLLLADMALHLLQTALHPEDSKHYRLQDNLYAILTISDQLLPKANLKEATKHIYNK